MEATDAADNVKYSSNGDDDWYNWFCPEGEDSARIVYGDFLN